MLKKRLIIVFIFFPFLISMLFNSPILIHGNNNTSEEYGTIINENIFIAGNENFTKFADNYQILGDGTKEQPFVIENFLFNNTINNKTNIEIKNTNVSIIITGSTFSSKAKNNVDFYNCKNIGIRDSIFWNSIGFEMCDSFAIDNNQFNNKDTHSILFWGWNSTITNNIINKESLGVYIWSAINTTFHNNQFIDRSVIIVDHSLMVNITENTCMNSGIIIRDSSNIIIKENVVVTMSNELISLWGIFADNVKNSTFHSNNISNIAKNGILIHSSTNNGFIMNTIENCGEYAIFIEGYENHPEEEISSFNNTFKFNIFISNNLNNDKSQIIDNITYIHKYYILHT